jgi:hypothetical protein
LFDTHVEKVIPLEAFNTEIENDWETKSPNEFVLSILIVKSPALGGVPEMTPVFWSMVTHAGAPEANRNKAG